MAVELEGLEFQIEAKSEEGTKGIDALTASLGKLKQATKGGLGLNSKVKELNKLNDALKGLHIEKLESLGKALDSLSKVGKAQISATIPKRISEIASSLHEIGWSDIEKLEDLSKALRDLQDIGNIRLPKVTVPSTGVAPASIQPETSGTEQATSSAQEAAHAVEQVTKKTNIFKSVLSGIGGVFSKGFSLGTGALHKLGNALTKVKVAGTKARDVLGKIKDVLGSALAAKIKQNTSGLGKLFSSMKRIAMYRAIRFMFSQLTQAMKDGINNLYQYSSLMGGTFAKSMDRLASSGQYLKNSLGAMAAPIINALAPAIDFVIGKIVELLNLINMLFARLTGKSTTTVAKKVSASFAESAGQASSAAKELQKSILGFDELNVMTDNSKSGGGGGGSTPDYGSMFEEVPIDTTISDFADKLKKAFMDADWESLGTLLGGKVNEILNSVDWGTMGSKLGYGLNGAIQTAYYFLKTVDFNRFGSHIATAINSALEQIDTSFIGRIIVRWFTSKFDFILGFLGTLNWGLIAKKLSDCVKGAFDEATEWLSGYDWSQMGKNLWANIKAVVTNIDWGGIATSIFTFLGKAIRSAVQFLGGFFGSVGSDIKNWWDKEIAGQDWKETAGNLLKAIGKGLGNIGTWVFDNIIDPFCGALLGEDVWADVKKAGSDLWAGFTKGITDFFADPGEWIKTNIVDPFVKWFKDLFGIHSPSTVMAEIGEFITEGLLEGMLVPLKNFQKWVEKNIIKPITDAFDKLGLVIEAKIELVKEGWDSLKEWVGEIGEKSVKLIRSGWRTLSSWAGEVGTKAVKLVQDGWTTLRDWVGDIGSKAFSLAKDGWTTVSTYVGNIGSKAFSLAKDGWTTVRTYVGDIGSKAFSLAKDGWSTVSSYVGNIGSKAFSLAKDGWTTVSTYVGNIGSKAFSLAKSGWTTVSDYVGSIGSKAVSLAKSGWTSLSSWVGNIGSKAVSLTKSGWTSLSSWVGSSVSAAVKLTKSGWTSISGYVGSAVSVGISLWKNGWRSISSFIGTSVSVGISLFKSGWSSIKKFFGLADGGILGANGGVKIFSNANGGIYQNGIPAFGGGTNGVNHGTMFVAGERGAEMVGHVNGRTEVMNRFQLASVMKSSIMEGMGQYAHYLTAINNHMTTCANATINAILYTADHILSAVNAENVKIADSYIAWTNEFNGGGNEISEDSSEQIAEAIRTGLYETTSRQNELLREQNELLRQILDKDTTVEVTANSVTKALNRKNQRDGKVIVPVGV